VHHGTICIVHYQAIRPLITAARLAPRAWKYVFVDDPELQRRAAERLRRTLSSEGWANTLRTIYDSGDEDAARRFPLLTLCGEAFPITVFPALDDGHNLDAALDDLIEDVPARKEFSPRYHDELKREFIGLTRIENRRGLFNGPAYLMDKFDTTAGTISARPGWYFEMKVTSHGLETELMNALRRRPDRTVPLSKLRKRAWVHEAAGDDPLRDGARRAAGISVAAVVLFSRPDGGYQILLPQRSKEVEQHPGFYHVAPSGIFSPIKEPETTGWRQEFSVFRCVLREYAEELFNYEDFEQGRDASGKLINAPVLEANPRIKNLLAAIKSGQVNFVYCGISVRGCPEFRGTSVAAR
jgi:hypothetical protein